MTTHYDGAYSSDSHAGGMLLPCECCGSRARVCRCTAGRCERCDDADAAWLAAWQRARADQGDAK